MQSEINVLSGAPCLQNSTHNDQLLTKLLDVQNTAFLLYRPVRQVQQVTEKSTNRQKNPTQQITARRGRKWLFLQNPKNPRTDHPTLAWHCRRPLSHIQLKFSYFLKNLSAFYSTAGRGSAKTSGIGQIMFGGTKHRLTVVRDGESLVNHCLLTVSMNIRAQ